MAKTKSTNSSASQAKRSGASSDYNKKKDTGGQKQKGKSTGSSRKGYNPANARGNICYGQQAWAAGSNIMSVIARVFNLTNIFSGDMSALKTTEDFINYIKSLKKDEHFWDGWAIVKISSGCTGIAKVLAGAGNAQSIDLKCTNLRMPEKRGSHVFYAEAIHANQYKGSILLDETDLEALYEVGLIPKQSQGAEGVEFVTNEVGTEVSQIHFRLREAAQCINPNCRLPREIAEKVRRKEEQDKLNMEVVTSYETEEIMEMGGQNSMIEEPVDLSDSDDEEKEESITPNCRRKLADQVRKKEGQAKLNMKIATSHDSAEISNKIYTEEESKDPSDTEEEEEEEEEEEKKSCGEDDFI
jgi:hypothetical protein